MARRINAMAMTLLLLSAFGAGAQALRDPTRPPGDSGVAGEDAAPAASRLQSVLISSGRRVAVISGQAVPLGGMVGEARVVKITETEVVLKKGDETEVLKMHPDVDKEPVKRGAARTAQLRRRDATADKAPLQEEKK
jgi:MSHA biogenesis protein MshK